MEITTTLFSCSEIHNTARLLVIAFIAAQRILDFLYLIPLHQKNRACGL